MGRKNAKDIVLAKTRAVISWAASRNLTIDEP